VNLTCRLADLFSKQLNNNTLDKIPIPIGVSPRHIHASKEDFITLFGEGSFLTKRKDLSQSGQFAAEQTVTLSTALGKIEQVRILGPFRGSTQVEISASDAVNLGLKAPVRDSGDHQGSPGIAIIGPKGVVELKQGVILAQRHIHMTPVDAKKFGVTDKQVVWAAVNSAKMTDLRSESRPVIFGGVLVRVDPSYRLDFHLDTDEANAAGVSTGDLAYIITSLDETPAYASSVYPRKRVYGEIDIRKAKKEGKVIIREKGTIFTPSALDYGKRWGVIKDGH